jgi:hypothetical protein
VGWTPGKYDCYPHQFFLSSLKLLEKNLSSPGLQSICPTHSKEQRPNVNSHCDMRLTMSPPAMQSQCKMQTGPVSSLCSYFTKGTIHQPLTSSENMFLAWEPHVQVHNAKNKIVQFATAMQQAAAAYNGRALCQLDQAGFHPTVSSDYTIGKPCTTCMFHLPNQAVRDPSCRTHCEAHAVWPIHTPYRRT